MNVLQNVKSRFYVIFTFLIKTLKFWNSKFSLLKITYSLSLSYISPNSSSAINPRYEGKLSQPLFKYTGAYFLFISYRGCKTIFLLVLPIQIKILLLKLYQAVGYIKLTAYEIETLQEHTLDKPCVTENSETSHPHNHMTCDLHNNMSRYHLRFN